MEVERLFEGERILLEYQRLKERIQADTHNTFREGDAVIVRGSIVDEGDGPRGERVRQKIRGGQVVCDPDYVSQFTSHVDDDPTTYDRISVERRVEGQEGVNHASLIYAERSLIDGSGRPYLVLDKWERYIRGRDGRTERGQRFVRVHCGTTAVIEEKHIPDDEAGN